MAGGKTQVFWLIVLLTHKYTIAETSTESEDLAVSESKDGKLEIIKQIKKVNEDGSYTIGYEADDGSFKIESRDVLGNIKGTYGFVDDNGEIKRVSYSTSNVTIAPPTTEADAPSVVQRIPRINRNFSSSTSPSSPTTPSPPSTTVVQIIPRRRLTYTTTTPKSSTTTERPSYSEFIKAAAEASKAVTQQPSSVVYVPPQTTTAHLLQGSPLLRSTASPSVQVQKSEGQIIRPEVVTTDLPIFRRLALNNPLADNYALATKPVNEEPEVHGNLLRRQLNPDKSFDAREHVANLRQSMGDDATHVYSSSFTTGTPRPLFTTSRPRVVSSTTPSPSQRVPVRFDFNYGEKNPAPETTEQSQDTTTESTETKYSTQPSIAQIPSSRQEPLIAIKHPFQQTAILVPVSQLQGRDSQFQYNPHYIPGEQYIREVPVNDPRPVYVQRVPPNLPPPLRSMPVQVDENGYVREVPRTLHRTPYPIVVAPTPVPNYEDDQNEVNQIRPPVTVRDFQKLLDQLITRQRRLEHISALTRRNPLAYNPRFRPVYQPTPVPYAIQRNPEVQTGPVQFIPHEQVQQSQRQYVPETQATRYEQPVLIRPQSIYQQQRYDPNLSPTTQSYAPSRRVARLLPRPPAEEQQQDIDEDDGYLPPDVREMLLLRMLQLAINPALPVEIPDTETQETTQAPSIRKGVRNVEILGEETENKKPMRVKRFDGEGAGI